MIAVTKKRLTRRALHFSLVRKIRRLSLRITKPRSFKNYNKVFCVGWQKTGTTSFGDGMRRLGFKHCSWDRDVWREWYEKGNIAKVFRYAKHFESFDDLPWNKIEILEQLDKEFPGSKFVLLERDSESWFKSFQKQLIKKGHIPSTDKASCIKKYEEHNEYVRQYFSGEKQKQLLIMNVINGDGYEKLCPFLELPVLNEPFPHSNKSKIRRRQIQTDREIIFDVNE